ncbi:FUSC family protein [Microbacterium marinilacus]|uniref:FUSC family protein n=1 Tax=Microbacterium marinilacus TaxID=415209 RepID=A0ABP7B229_9MICO|nr:FUSC family protein [Microbacterium marinilacus]MBY0688583.1 FUSC family protein [Microbacterium marinilacus]
MSRVRTLLPSVWRGLTYGPRVALALRTAVAAGVAWYLAPSVPFAENEYSYYAPLGVLVSMYPTLARSARSGMQALVGLALGIVLGFGGIGLVWLGAPGIVALAVVVGVGVWLGGIEPLQVGREWIAMAGLFVLLLGGPTPDDFSVSYLVTMAFGVAVGLVANLLLVPPLRLQRAAARLSELRDALARHLHDIAEAVESGSLMADDLDAAALELDGTIAQVAEAVRDADESSRANPRARRHVDDRDLNQQRLRALRSAVFSARDLADMLARADAEHRASLPEGAWSRLAEAIRGVADLTAQPPGDEGTAERLRHAEAALDRYTSTFDAHAQPSQLIDDLAIAVCVRRMIDAARPFA